MMGIDKQILLRTSRLSLTCILLFLVSWYFEVPQYSWGLITIIVVMFDNTTLGGVISKSKLRLWGTSLSALYGLVIIYTCDNNALVNILAFIPGIFVYSYFFMAGDKVYIGIIGAVTLTIVLFNYNDIDIAILRVFNIILGIIASLLMMRFFYPQYAQDKMLETYLEMMKQLSLLLNHYLDKTQTLALLKQNYLDYEHRMIALIQLTNRYAQEAAVENPKMPQFIQYQAEVTHHIRHLFRLCSVLVYHLTTESVRSNPSIREKIMELLALFTDIQCMLESERVDHQQPDAIHDRPKHRMSKPFNSRQTIHTLLTTMCHEAELLYVEVKKIASYPGMNKKNAD